MTVPTPVAPRAKRLKIAAAVLAVLVLARVVAPVPPTGYWRGDVFDCLCNSDTVVEFSQHQAIIHFDSKHPFDSERSITSERLGDCNRVGWRTHHLLSDDGGIEANYLIHPGWLFAQFTHVQTGETYWAVREWNLVRLRKIWTAVQPLPTTSEAGNMLS